MEPSAQTLRWQATTRRLCLYMAVVPAVIGLSLWRKVDPLLIGALAFGALLLFIAVILYTYAKLQDDPNHG